MLADWIEYGLKTEDARKKAIVRRWLREARERRPVRDWVNYPDCGYERRQFARG
jgi:hypothetical protein